MIRKETWGVTGMTCSACSSRVEKGVAGLQGMRSASVNLLAGCMKLEYDDDVLPPQAVSACVAGLGYGTVPPEAGGKAKRTADERLENQRNEAAAMKRRLILSLCFLLPLMYVSMHRMLLEHFGLPVPEWLLGIFSGRENAVTFAFTQFLLLLPIMVLNGKFYRVGFRTLAKGSPNMDSLIAIGSGAAAAYGVFVLYRLGWALGHGDAALLDRYSMDIYFESAGTILTLITLGKWLETRSKARTGSALAGLMALTPDTACVERGGSELTVPADEVAAGDIVILRPGDRVPVDGTVVEGSSSADESAITGESLPVEKTPGDKVTAATINKTGFLRIRADRVGDDMAISRIIRLVEDAGATKAPIARTADRIAGVFVPVVIAIAVLAFSVWMLLGAGLEFSLSIAISVLVISCPCALGLATPVAIMVGTGRGAELGILFKSGEALERAHSIDTVVLDKTGTLTEGHPRVTDLEVLSGTRSALVAIAAGIEHGSGHPLAEAVSEFASEQGIAPSPADSFTLVPGRGVSANIEGFSCHAGNAAMMEELGIDVSEASVRMGELADAGKTPLLIARGKTLLGILAVADTVKPTSAQAVRELRSLGIRTVMITGDNRRTADALRREIELDDVVAQALPEDKEKHIAAMQAEGHRVAMIGDGINDAPALARADVGIAIGAGTDIAVDSADVVLIRSDLTDAVDAIRLGGAVIRNIRQNLFWAFFYNSIGIPLAAGLFYSLLGWKLNPMFGAAAMSMSSVCVVTNALRLRFFTAGRPSSSGAGDSDPQAAHGVPALPPAAQDASAPAALSPACTAVPCPPAASPAPACRAVLHVQGMMCSHCTGRVAKALAEAGAEADVSLEAGTASVASADGISLESLVKAVEDAGYPVTSVDGEQAPAPTRRAVLHVQGMMCSHCTGRVAKALAEAGAEADVSLEAGTASVAFADGISLESLVKAVEDAGYPVTSVD